MSMTVGTTPPLRWVTKGDHVHEMRDTSLYLRRGLGIADLGDLVELPLLGVLATYRRDGSVLLSPVWHEWRDGGFNVVTHSTDGKAGHMRRDPRANIVVCEHVPPHPGVELRTEGELVPPGGEEGAVGLAPRDPGA